MESTGGDGENSGGKADKCDRTLSSICIPVYRVSDVLGGASGLLLHLQGEHPGEREESVAYILDMQ